jgi:SAM-dependent methyltransferase
MTERSNDKPSGAAGPAGPASEGFGPGGAYCFAPAIERNRQPILDVLSRALPESGRVLEVASGSGEHALWFAQHLYPLVWQPSDLDPACRCSIAAHAAGAGLANLEAPLELDAAWSDWPIEAADSVVCINMIHIAPWQAAEGLVAGAARILPPGGVLYLYGAYMRGGHHTAPSNAAFDAALRAYNPDWGLRDVEAVAEAAGPQGLVLSEVVEMPANNLSLVFTRR